MLQLSNNWHAIQARARVDFGRLFFHTPQPMRLESVRVIDAYGMTACSRGAVRLALSSLSSSANVLRKYFHDRSTKDWLLVKKARGGLFDCLPQQQKLFPAGDTFSTLHSREHIHGSVANLTHDDVVVVEHGKPEGSSFLVVSFDSVTDQGHGQHPAGEYTGALKCIGPSIKSTGSAQESNATFYRVMKLSHKARSGVDFWLLTARLSALPKG